MFIYALLHYQLALVANAVEWNACMKRHSCSVEAQDLQVEEEVVAGEVEKLRCAGTMEWN
jgi:hypothetical protein